MKDSGVEWLGMVPEHWDVKPGRACYSEKKEPNTGLVEKTVLSLSYGKIVVKPEDKLHGLVPASFETYQIIEPGDIICRPTDLQNDYNSLRFGLSDHRGIITSAYMCFNTHENLDYRYGHLLFHSYDLLKIFYGLGSGLRQNLSWEDFKYLPCVIPSLPEQVAIARYLNYVDARVRRLTEAKRKLIGLLTEYKQAIVHRAVTRGLDPNVPLKDPGIEWLGMVPQHWEVRRFKTEVANIIDQTDRRDEDDEYIALEHVESWTGKIYPAPPDMSFDSQVKKFEPGDVLFGKLRPYLAKIARPKRKGVCVSEFFVFRPRNGKLSAGYLEQFLRSSSVIGVINSSTFGAKMPRTDWKYIGNLSQLIPPLPEQVAIVEYLDRTTAEIDIAVARAERQIELLNEYRTRLIADVVTGKLDVRDATLDPEEIDR